MRIRELQENLKKLLVITDNAYSVDILNGFNSDLDLVLSAKIMALDLLQEDNPKEVLLEAFIQLFLVATILNLDLEKEVQERINQYGGLSSQGS